MKCQTADLLSCVQNDEDDWQENEELRAIEGLEGVSDRQRALQHKHAD